MLFASIWDSFLAQASVSLLFQYAATLSGGEGDWFISAKWTIPEFPEIFPGIDLVSIIYVRYCGFASILPFLLGALWKKVTFFDMKKANR